MSSLLAAAKGRHDNLVVHKKCRQIEDATVAGKYVHGRLWAGPYGTNNPLVDSVSGAPAYEQKTTDARMEPFFFLFYLPDEFKKGILLAQRTGLSGVKTLLADLVTKDFKVLYPDYRLDVFPLMPEQAIQALLQKSRLSEIRFIKSEIPSDYAEKFNKNNQAQDGEMEVILRPRRKGYLNPGALMDIFSRKKTANDFLEMEDFEPDNIKAEIESNGRRRIIDFGHPDRFRASFEITDDIALGMDNHPTLDSLLEVAKELSSDIAEKMKIL